MKRRIQFAYHKFYFDKGWGLLSYFKYVFALLGLGSIMQGYNIKLVVYGALFYGIFCYMLGRFWVWSKMVEAELEVGNRLNLFVREMRKSIKKQKI